MKPLVVKNLSCKLNLGAQFNYKTGFIPQRVISGENGRKTNFSELDGVRIRLQFQDVSNKTLRRTVGNPEFLQWLRREPLEQHCGVEYVLPHTLHITTLVQQENQRRKGFKKMSFQPTLSDSEDPELERMVNRARLTTTAQFYVKDKNEGLTDIGPVKELPAKKIGITLSNIPQWSKKSLKQHVKKIEENWTLI